MTQQEHIKEWLQEHPLLSKNGLEKKCGIPQAMLSRFVTGDYQRGLPDKYLPALMKELKRYGYDPLIKINK